MIEYCLELTAVMFGYKNAYVMGLHMVCVCGAGGRGVYALILTELKFRICFTFGLFKRNFQTWWLCCLSGLPCDR